MKKILILAFGMFIMTNLSKAQTLYTANNNPGANTGVNVFTGSTAMQDAFTASAAGDIIYLVPSSVPYGNLNITHSITLFGVGIRPDKDLGAKSLVGQINIDADDVRLSGLTNSIGTNLEIRIGWNSGTSNINGITIENCNITRVLMTAGPTATVSNLLIRNNVITGTGSLATHILLNTTSNAIITNNIMIEGGSGSMIKALNATLTYNAFVHSGDEPPFSDVVNCIIDHNIFYGIRVDVPATATGNTWTYNLAFGNSPDSRNVFNTTTNGNTGIGNIESVSGNNDPLFVNLPLISVWDNSYDLTLQAGSPALNVNGEDIGPSGGATPFDFEGNLLPLIQSVTIPAVIPLGTDLPITIKAKGN